MSVIIEDFVPYDRSIRWKFQDAYFIGRGLAAWQAGDIPYMATSNYAIARQHATLFLGIVEALTKAGELGPNEEVFILELGCGNGEFAASFLRALTESCGDAGKGLSYRLRYLLSDFSSEGVREAIATPKLRGFVQSHLVLPAILDLRKPSELYDLNGNSLDPPLTTVVANYVCGALPIKVLRKDSTGLLEKYVRVQANHDDDVHPEEVIKELLSQSADKQFQASLEIDYQWRSVQPETTIQSPTHRSVIDALTVNYPIATVPYPISFLEALVTLSDRMTPSGVFLISDFGSCRTSSVKGERDFEPSIYGNSLAHGVNFAVIEAFARTVGWDVARTNRPAQSLHTACLFVTSNAPPAFHLNFHNTHIHRTDGQDLLDFRRAGFDAMKARDFNRAVRQFERCLQLDSSNPEILYSLGEAYIEIGYPEDALRYLETGRTMDEESEYDCNFQLGRAYHRLGRQDEAIQSYERSLKCDDHPVTRTNLGMIFLGRGEHALAYQNLQIALSLDPTYRRASEALERVKTEWCETTLSPST